MFNSYCGAAVATKQHIYFMPTALDPICDLTFENWPFGTSVGLI